MIKAEVQWLQRNNLTRLDYDARYAAESSVRAIFTDVDMSV